MDDRMTRRRDRRLVLASLFSFLLGALCLAIAVWGVRHPEGDVSATVYRAAPPELGFLAGPIFVGTGIYELVHRLRSGPQPPGRHGRGE